MADQNKPDFKWVDLTTAREECRALIQPKNRFEYNNYVTECVFSKFGEVEKAVFASRQYILTLWPAFVGFICGLSSDPSIMVYDNLWWSVLFALTCSGLPGMSDKTPPHHIEVLSTSEGRGFCERWVFNPEKPQAVSRTKANRHFNARPIRVRFEWVAFLFSVAIYLIFCALFAYTLKDSVSLSFPIHQWAQWLAPAVWYYISASPAVWAAINELLQNRVQLFEPIPIEESRDEYQHDRDEKHVDIPVSRLQSAGLLSSSTDSTESTGQFPIHKPLGSPTAHVSYALVKTRSVFHMWWRILRHQWQRSQYRILIKPRSKHWFFLISGAGAGIGRIVVFALGSITMGNVLLMPVPNDLALFVLLLFVTAIPRHLWPEFWEDGARGADLVVWVKPVGLLTGEDE
jgi:hypothetical protein